MTIFTIIIVREMNCKLLFFFFVNNYCTHTIHVPHLDLKSFRVTQSYYDSNTIHYHGNGIMVFRGRTITQYAIHPNFSDETTVYVLPF